MNHTTSIGLDVHARSIAAAALDPLTGEVVTKTFAYSPGEVASWALGFDSPKAVYESGVTGFHLCRELNALGLECAVGASSKTQRPPADVKRKNDLSDAQFLARLLATHNVTEVFVPDAETEAARDLVRAHAGARADLTRARKRLNLFLMRHGHVFCEKGPTGAPVGSWTKAHWAWIRQISFPDEADEEALAFYIAQVRHMEGQKRELEKFIRAHAREPRWCGRVDALRCLKGIEEITAFALVAEAGVFSRFDGARAFSTWAGLVPSEHSSGPRRRTGGITKTGNSNVRRLLVEASWHYARATAARKPAPSPDVPLRIENHAAKAVKRLVARRREMSARGKRPSVANCATARELACWCWAIGRMAEGADA